MQYPGPQGMQVSPGYYAAQPPPPVYYTNSRQNPGMQYPGPQGMQASPGYYATQPPPPVYSNQSGMAYQSRDSEGSPESSGMNAGIQRSRLFSSATIRRGFIRKVYSILSCQLLFTLGVIALFIFSDPVKSFVQRNSWVYLSSVVLFIITYLVLVCVESCRRKTPSNYFCLGILTVSLSYMTGTLSRYDTHIVFLAVGITAIVTLSLTVFAFQTKIDFTLCSGFLCAATMVVILMGFILSLATFVFGYSRILSIVYAGIAALLFCMYLVYDTQLLMGGHRFALSEEEYILAAIQLYLDIVMLFTYILQITGFASND